MLARAPRPRLNGTRTAQPIFAWPRIASVCPQCGSGSTMSALVQVSRTPASRDYRGARTTGVGEAPRPEIAGRKGLGFADAVYGDLRRPRGCFRDVRTTHALRFGEVSGRGERALPALRPRAARRAPLQPGRAPP